MTQFVQILKTKRFPSGFLFLLAAGIAGAVVCQYFPFSGLFHAEPVPPKQEKEQSSSPESRAVSPTRVCSEQFLNVGRENIFDPLYEAVEVKKDAPSKKEETINPGAALQDWKLEYVLKKKTIWHFSNKHRKDESYDMEVGKTYTLYDRGRPFEITVVRQGKWGVTLVHSGPPEQRKTFSLVEQ